MGSTFVSLGIEPRDDDPGFWMTDYVLELWLRLLCLHIPEPTDAFTQEHRELTYSIRNQWLLASRGWFIGCVPHGLEDACLTDDGRSIVRAAIESLMRALQDAPLNLEARQLNLLRWDEPFRDDFESQRLIEVGQAFLELLDGKITCTAKSIEYMPGCR
jgi:hypothetical protein